MPSFAFPHSGRVRTEKGTLQHYDLALTRSLASGLKKILHPSFLARLLPTVLHYLSLSELSWSCPQMLDVT
jgi:hypothetical protein